MGRIADSRSAAKRSEEGGPSNHVVGAGKQRPGDIAHDGARSGAAAGYLLAEV